MDNTLIKDIPIKERPRERLKLYGKENVSNEELLSIILNTGVKNKSVKELSNSILSKMNDISDLKNFSEQIIEVVQRYLHPVLLKEVLYTRWGNYEMPEPYKILLEKGPRKNLKKL